MPDAGTSPDSAYVSRPASVSVELLDQAGLGVLILDAEDRIKDINAALLGALRQEAQEVLGRPCLELLRPEARAEAQRRLASLRAGAAVEAMEAPLLIKGEGEIWFRISLRAQREEIHALLQDLTKARQDAAQLRQAQKMEALGQLASGIAHEFNNTLMGVLACAQLATRHLRSAPERAEALLLELRQEATGSANLIRQLLSFGRQRPTTPERIEVEPVIAAAEPLLRRLVRSTVSLRIQLEAKKRHVQIEPGQIEQLLVNLAVNASHAMPKGGALLIHARVEEEALVLEVRDEGVGIPEELHRRIFEPFFTTKPEGEGSGLGLSTVYSIVQRAQGRISVQSAPGQGSTFRVHLPLASKTPPERTLPQALIIEPDPLARLAIQQGLEALGYLPLVATSGAEALSLARQCSAAKLLITAPMPGGEQLERELRTLHPELRLLYTSKRTQEALMQDGLPSLDAPLLLQPFTEAQLEEAVQLALDTPSSAPAPSPERRAVVLLVEDYEVARLACRELLEDLGYTVLQASTAQEARAHGERQDRIDVLLTDLGLPDLPGHLLARELLKQHPKMGIIYMSGSSVDRTELEPEAVLIDKPVELDELAAHVRALSKS